MAAFQQVFRAIITADAGGAIREYRKYEGTVDKSTTAAAKQLGKTEKAMNRVKTAAAAIGVTAGVALGRHAVNAARDLTESVNAVNVMYGENAAEILRISETAAAGVGLSERAFNESAVAVGGFVNQIAAIEGVGAAGVLDELITRAADFGSVFNIDVDEALQRFRSGLAGETEPLRRFGINLLQSEVNAYAFANGIAEIGETLTEEEKVLARYQLLLQKTDQMSGDFAATSGELANQQRILKADLENTAAEFGEAIVPAAQAALEIVSEFFQMLNEWQVPEALKELTGFLFGDQSVGDTVLAQSSSAFREGEQSIRDMADAMMQLGSAGVEGMGWLDRLDEATFGDFPGLERAPIMVRHLQMRFMDLQNTAPEMASAYAGAFASMAVAAQGGDQAARQFFDYWFVSVEDAIQLSAQWTQATLGSSAAQRHAGRQSGVAAQRQLEAADATNALTGEQQLSITVLEEARRKQRNFDTAVAMSARSLDDMNDELVTQVELLGDVKNSYTEYMEELDDRRSLLSVSEQVDQVQDLHAAWLEAEAGTEEAERAARDYELGMIDLRAEVGEYLTQVEGIPESFVTQIVAEMDFDSITTVEEALGALARGETHVPLILDMSAGDRAIWNAFLVNRSPAPPAAPSDPPPASSGGGVLRFDSGGVIPGPIGAPRLVLAHAGETVLPTHRRGGGAVGGPTIVIQGGIIPDPVEAGRLAADALESYYRNGGQPPRSG